MISVYSEITTAKQELQGDLRGNSAPNSPSRAELEGKDRSGKERKLSALSGSNTKLVHHENADILPT